MKTKYLNSLVLVAALTAIGGLTSCQTWDKLDRTEQGALIGAGGGAALGSAMGGTKGAVLGGIGGGVAGGAIGHNTH